MKDREQYEQWLQEQSPDAVVIAGENMTTIVPRDREARPICDFCGTVPGSYVFPAHDTTIASVSVLGDNVSVGGWGACDMCKKYIELNDVKALEARAVNLFAQRRGIEPDELLSRSVRTSHRAFFKARIT